jgi:lipoprotein-anchoring transpeptidase ErfK/SrfK
MSTAGRVVTMLVAAGALVVVTVLATRYLIPPEPAPPAPPPDLGRQGTHTEDVVVPPGGPGPGEGALAASKDGTTAGLALPPAAGPGEAAADDGLAQMASGRYGPAQVRLSEALRAGVEGPKGKAVREALASLADRLQFSAQKAPDDPYSKTYAVARGDSLIRIGQKFVITPELLMRLNHLSTSDIGAGQSLKVVQGPVHVEIYKGRYEIQAWLDTVCLRVWPVGIGAENRTPEGTFIVTNKIKNPPYQPQHKTRAEHKAAGAPDNPLGGRWIDIGNHYGIHGTIDPASIGRGVSEGCIRMSNKNVEELYDLVVVGASKVTIRP